MKRINPYPWILWIVVITCFLILTYNPLYHFLLLLLLIYLAEYNKVKWKTVLKVGLLLAALPSIINLLLSHEGEHVLLNLPKSISLKEYSLPTFFIAGPITLESLMFSFTLILLLLNILLAYAIFNEKVNQDYLLMILPSHFSHSALLFSISLKFVPNVIADYKNISEAQLTRGLKLKSISPLKRLQKRIAIFLPMLTMSFERAYQLAESLEARVYGKGKRSRYHSITWSRRDKAIAVGLLMLLPVFITDNLWH